MIRIAITGPESTGKSTLAAWLAEYYGTVWVPEFARTYINDLNQPYTLADIVAIAQGQAQAEELLEQKATDVLFCDSDFFVLKIWAEHAFGVCPEEIREKIATRPYHLHLLMDVDLPWEPDPQREHPHLRHYFLQKYQQVLTEAGANWALISGTENERNVQAVKILENLFPVLQKNRPARSGFLPG